MEFYRIPRKKVEVPIVSLIDILTILLIFFIVTTKPKDQRPVLNVEVPLASGELTSKITESRSVLAVSAEGDITLGAVRILPGTLTQYLKSFRNVEPGRKLELKIDQGCSFGTMVMVWEALKEAGFGINEVPHRVRLPDNKVPSDATSSSPSPSS